MFPSSALCREQQAVQRDRAASTLLENVRIVAERAAIAWGVEAAFADRREARRERLRTIAANAPVTEAMMDSTYPLSASENPDRGLAEQPPLVANGTSPA